MFLGCQDQDLATYIVYSHEKILSEMHLYVNSIRKKQTTFPGQNNSGGMIS